MKKLITILAISLIVFTGCKKDDPEPEVKEKIVEKEVIKTVTVTETDTVYCMLKSEIVQGNWYVYKRNEDPLNFTASFGTTSYSWNSGTVNNITYDSDYSTVYRNGNLQFTVKIYDCEEIVLTDDLGDKFYIRRNP
jgi:hypothetical protein